MKHRILILIYLQVFLLIPNPIHSQNIDSTDLLSFTQKIDLISKQESVGIQISFANIDSVSQTVDILVEFYCPNGPFTALLTDIGSAKAKNNNRTNSKLNNSISFEKVKLFYNDGWNVLKSKDSLLQAKINGMESSAVLKGKIQLKPSDPGLSIYLMTADSSEYYFHYSRLIMTFFSTDTNFMTSLEKIGYNRRELKGSKNLYSYTIMTSSHSRLDKFVKMFDELE